MMLNSLLKRIICPIAWEFCKTEWVPLMPREGDSGQIG